MLFRADIMSGRFPLPGVWPLSTDSPLIIALDYASLDAALCMADQLDPSRCRLKVGKELFTRSGPDVLDALHGRGFEVFLDLKFHDIPNTVAGAVQAAAEQGVWMVNVHAGGGRRMMEAARERLQQHGLSTHLIAVTVLTSMEAEDLAEVGIGVTPAEQVERLALLARASGMDGVVCSAQEAARLRELCGGDFLKVTPGIRPSFAAAGDQRRVMTPAQAMAAGSTHLVVGRPVTQAEDPMAALAAIEAELAAGWGRLLALDAGDRLGGAPAAAAGALPVERFTGMAAPPAAVTRQRREQGGGVLLQQLQLLEGFADAVLAVEVDQVVQRPQARFPVELFADQVDGGLEPLPVSNRLGQQDDHAGVGGARHQLLEMAH